MVERRSRRVQLRAGGTRKEGFVARVRRASKPCAACGFVTVRPAAAVTFVRLARPCAGTNFALDQIVRARRIGQTLLIFVPLLICGARFHAGALGTPAGVTQEVARCLNMVRVAAARRNGRQLSEPDRRRTASGRNKIKE